MKPLIAERDKQQLRLAEFENVVTVQFTRAIHFLAVAVGDAATFAGEDFEAVLVGIETENGVFAAGDGVIAANANIHAGVAANEIAFAVNPVITALVGAVNADQPAHDGIKAGAFTDQADGAAFARANPGRLVKTTGLGMVVQWRWDFLISTAFSGLHRQIGNAAGGTAAIAGVVVIMALGTALHDGQFLGLFIAESLESLLCF